MFRRLLRQAWNESPRIIFVPMVVICLPFIFIPGGIAVIAAGMLLGSLAILGVEVIKKFSEVTFNELKRQIECGPPAAKKQECKEMIKILKIINKLSLGLFDFNDKTNQIFIKETLDEHKRKPDIEKLERKLGSLSSDLEIKLNKDYLLEILRQNNPNDNRMKYETLLAIFKSNPIGSLPVFFEAAKQDAPQVKYFFTHILTKDMIEDLTNKAQKDKSIHPDVIAALQKFQQPQQSITHSNPKKSKQEQTQFQNPELAASGGGGRTENSVITHATRETNRRELQQAESDSPTSPKKSS